MLQICPNTQNVYHQVRTQARGLELEWYVDLAVITNVSLSGGDVGKNVWRQAVYGKSL
jgi:hypothetical protein